MSAPLPQCPLCGKPPETVSVLDHPRHVCHTMGCAMGHTIYTEVEWRRLAAPLAPEIVEMLRALALPDGRVRKRLLAVVREAWIAANCPGLPPEKE